MPTSDLYNILPILTVIQRLKPRSVLDVGCGFGKYGVLLREYLDVCHGRLDPSEWQVRLVGNDAFAGYRNPLWEYIYDEIHVGEAQEVVPTLGRFDVILLADIIEHFEKHAAIRMVEICLEQAGAVVISTPERFHEQGAVYGNPHEIHRILWTRADFPRGCYVTTIPMKECLIFVASKSYLPAKTFYPARLPDLLYIRSRKKLRGLGPLGRLLSLWLWLLSKLLA